MPKRARLNFHGGAWTAPATWNGFRLEDFGGPSPNRKAITNVTVVNGTTLAVSCTAHGAGTTGGSRMYCFTELAGDLGAQLNGVTANHVAGGDADTIYLSIPSTAGLAAYTSGGYINQQIGANQQSTYKTLRDDTDGTETGWRLHGYYTTGYEYANTGMNSVGSGDAAWVDAAEVSAHFWGTTELSYLFSGLDNTKTYTVELFSSRDTTASRSVNFIIGGTTVALDAWDNSSNVARITGVSPVNGTLFFRVVENNAVDYAYLNAIRIEEVAAGDVTAPVLSSPTAVSTGATTATVGATTNEGNGTLYVVVTTSSTQPSVAQIKAGQNHAGAAAAWAGSTTVVATGAATLNATGLSGLTVYYAHFVHTDAASNNSNVVSSSSFLRVPVVPATILRATAASTTGTGSKSPA